MKKCKVCGKELSKKAKMCPSCGEDQRNFFTKHKILTVLGAIVIVGAIGGATGSDSNSQEIKEISSNEIVQIEEQQSTKQEIVEEPSIEILATDLIQAYGDNEVRADKEYKNKKIKITGVVDSIDTTLDQTSILLTDGAEFSFTGVQCFFAEEYLDQIAELNKGDTITIEGKVDGYVAGLNVVINNCAFK